MTENFENNRNRSIKELKTEIKKRGHTGYSKLNKNLCGQDGRTICGPQRVPKSTCVSL